MQTGIREQIRWIKPSFEAFETIRKGKFIFQGKPKNTSYLNDLLCFAHLLFLLFS